MNVNTRNNKTKSNVLNSVVQSPSMFVRPENNDDSKSVNTRNNKNKSNEPNSEVQSPAVIGRSDKNDESKLKEFSKTLLKKLSDMETRITERINSVSADVCNMRMDLKDALMRLDVAEEKLCSANNEIISLNKRLNTMENSAIATDCIVYNIPVSADADVVVKSAFAALECNSLEPVKVFRTSNNRDNKSKSLPVIVKLRSADDRIMLFKAIAAYRKKFKKHLMLSDIGLDGDELMSIFECLTITNRGILNAALLHKRNKRIISAFSLRGNVYVRVRENDKAVLVDDLMKLEAIVGGSMV